MEQMKQEGSSVILPALALPRLQSRMIDKAKRKLFQEI
jgi:hypothetical protein